MRDETEDYRERVRKAQAGESALQEDEEAAREVIERLGQCLLAGGRLTAAEERRLRDALSLVRRAEKISAEELRLRARRGWI